MQIIQYVSNNLNILYCKTKHMRQSTKLNIWSQKVLLYYIEQNLNDNLTTLGTFFKSGYKLFWAIVQSYLKTTGY